MFRSIRTRLMVTFIGLAAIPLLLVGAFLISQSFQQQRAQALAIQGERAQRVAQEVEAYLGGITSQLDVVARTETLMDLPRDRQQATLERLSATSDVFRQLLLVARDGQELVRIENGRRVPPRRELHLSSEVPFSQPLLVRQPYYGRVDMGEDMEPLITLSVPVLDQTTGYGSGVIIARVRFQNVWDLIADEQVRSGETLYIVDFRDLVVAHQNPAVTLGELFFTPPEADGIHAGLAGDEVILSAVPVTFDVRTFTVVAERTVAEALAPAVASTQVTSAIFVITLLVATGLGVLAVRRIVRPVQELAQAAFAVQTGDYSRRVSHTSEDEIGLLARAFNDMTSQLLDLVVNLERRVAERTRALETSAQVSRSLSTILDQDRLVAAVVQQIKGAFDYYHVHIYLLHEARQQLVMAGGTGTAGQTMLAQGHAIPVGKGLVGRAAATGEVVLVPDVSQNSDWLPNPLLPETKAEIAIPIQIGSRLLGILDVQHNVTGGLTDEDAQLLQSVANQVAVALRNARLYEEAQRQADQEAIINQIGQRIQTAGDVESVLRIASEELGRTLAVKRASVQLGQPAANGGNRAQGRQ